MTATQINYKAPLLRTLTDFGLADEDKITLASFYFDAVTMPKITFREYSTVYLDDPDNQRRIVLRLTRETKKLRGKMVPVPTSIPRLVVSNLKGYDSLKNMWGNGGHDEASFDLTVEEATAFHQQLEAIRGGMAKDPHHWTWYRRDMALAS